MDRGAWQATVHRVAKSRTRMSDFTFTFRDLFKKIRDTKGTFHAKMGTIKDRNRTDLREAEDTKRRWQECTDELGQ